MGNHKAPKLVKFRLSKPFVVEKLSGPKGHLGDQRAWFFWDQSEAEKAVERIVREKTSPGRKRVYRVRTIAGETRNCDEGREPWSS